MKILTQRAQNVMEYTLLIAGIIAVSIVALRQGGPLDKTLNKSLAKSVSATECMALNTCYDPNGCPHACGNGCCEAHAENPSTCNTDCTCATDADCNDGQFCNGIESCQNGNCLSGTGVNINDGVGCTDDACNESLDIVVHTANNAHCDDALACNGVETCDASLDCQTGTAIDVNDGIACTVDTCVDPSGTVVHTPNDSVCNNGQYCDGVETCSTSSGCLAGTAVDPDDGVACTDDFCDEVNDTILHVPNDSLCDNGLFCDGSETCSVLGCQPGTPLILSDGVGCTVDACNEAADTIDHTPDDALCDNGLYCDGNETCSATADCQAGTPPVTDDSVSCTHDYCDETTDTVVHGPDDTVCDDGLFCDGTEFCDPTLDCQAGTAPVIDDGVGCTDDACYEPTDVIVHTPNDALCSDGLFCDGTETCHITLDCQAGTPPDPNDNNPCTDDSCVEGTGVVHTPNTVSCDDGLVCNGVDMCDGAGVCQSGTPPNVDDGVACTVDQCTEPGTVSHTPADSLCSSGYYCDAGLGCQPYQCVGSVPSSGINCSLSGDANDESGLAANDTWNLMSSCTSAKCEYICNDAAGYMYSGGACVPKNYCTMPNTADPGTVGVGTVMNFYMTQVMSCGTNCIPYARQCQSGGTWSGNSSAIYQSCTAPCANCLGPGNITITHNTSRRYYQYAAQPCSGSNLCLLNSEMRYCYNGTLYGTFANPNCTQAACGVCVGTFSNANLCPNDQFPPTNTSSTLTAACSPPLGGPPFCQYTCAGGYTNYNNQYCYRCGDGACTGPETCSTCPGDCGNCPNHNDTWQGYQWYSASTPGSSAAALEACNHYWFDGNYCRTQSGTIGQAYCDYNTYPSICYDATKNPYSGGNYFFPTWIYSGCWSTCPNYCAGNVLKGGVSCGVVVGSWY